MKTVIGRVKGFINGLSRRSPRTYEGLLQAEDFFGGPTLDWDPGRERVLVLAPHMDDEVIGCGGTVARHVDAGADVTVAYLTDGRQGSAALFKLKGEELRKAQQTLINTRRDEARRALAHLGVTKSLFLDAEDTRLLADPDLPRRLRAVLLEVKPTLVYVPFFLEHHPDHRGASGVLLAAVQGTDLEFMCHGYEVWTPLFPNCMVWIDSAMARKQLAMGEYRSQLEDTNDLMHAMNGLAAYRSVVRSRKQGRFAEAFCALPLAEYRKAHAAFAGTTQRQAPVAREMSAGVGTVSGPAVSG
jgi:N-acetylglucosamine malate deacetylase 1